MLRFYFFLNKLYTENKNIASHFVSLNRCIMRFDSEWNLYFSLSPLGGGVERTVDQITLTKKKNINKSGGPAALTRGSMEVAGCTGVV